MAAQYFVCQFLPQILNLILWIRHELESRVSSHPLDLFIVLASPPVLGIFETHVLDGYMLIKVVFQTKQGVADGTACLFDFQVYNFHMVVNLSRGAEHEVAEITMERFSLFQGFVMSFNVLG